MNVIKLKAFLKKYMELVAKDAERERLRELDEVFD